nr:GLUT-1 [Onchidium reevesii]
MTEASESDDQKNRADSSSLRMREMENGDASDRASGGKQKSTTCRLIMCIVGAVMGSLQFGYNVGVINAPESLIKKFMNETTYKRDGSSLSEDAIRNLWALTASIFSVGGCFGGFLAGWCATKLGRKGGSLSNIVLGVVASVLMFASRRAGSFEMIIVGRILIGFHAGIYTGISPMYLSEISTPNIRGAVGVLHQLAIVTGILSAQILGFPDLLGTEDSWDILLGLAIVPCLMQGLILPFCPESPRYLLITKGDEKKCREALVILRGTRNIEDEVDEIKQEASSCGDQLSIIDLFRIRSLRWPLLIGVVMQLSQQLSGVNGVFFYSTNLFKEAGLSDRQATYTTSAVGATMVIMTLVSIPLIDRLGRRSLHLTGIGGMAVFSILVTIALALRERVNGFDIASTVFVLIYMVFFAIGPGSIPWLIVAELFSHDARPAAMSISVLVNWLSSFTVGFVFPNLQESLQDYTFLPFTGLLVLFFLFTFFFVPETKGKTFEEVSALWRTKDTETPGSSPSINKLNEALDQKGPYGSTNGAYSPSSEFSDDDKKIIARF